MKLACLWRLPLLLQRSLGSSTLLDVNRQQRSVLAEKLADTANLAVAGMVFGQTLSGEPFSPLLAVAGSVMRIRFLALSVLLTRGNGA